MGGWKLAQLAHKIKQGAIIVYPTDTVWGIGCHPLLQQSVQQVCRIKQRPLNKPMILLASTAAQLQFFIQADTDTLPAATPTTPTTWIVEASEDCPGWLKTTGNTIACRVTRHPLITALCGRLNFPLISTSANLSGRTTIRNSIQAERQFGKLADVVVHGYSTGGKKASKIIHLKTGQLLRH